MNDRRLNFWNRGPREWSPRLARGLRMVRELHDLFPKHMLAYYKGMKPRQIRTLSTFRGEEKFMLAFTVSFEKEGPHGGYIETDGVWISPEGVVDVGMWIRQMLKEGLKGYESLAGRWPWKDE